MKKLRIPILSIHKHRMNIYDLNNGVTKDAICRNARENNDCNTNGISIIYQPQNMTRKLGLETRDSVTKLLNKSCISNALYLKTSKSTEYKIGSFLSAICVICAISLLTTAILILLNSVDPVSVNVSKQKSRIVTIKGEFHITNEVFRDPLLNHDSKEFQKLANKISTELDKLFSESVLSEEYCSSVVAFSRSNIKTPGLLVKNWLALKPTHQLTAERVGMAFLGGLIHKHGKVLLGNFTVDIQSIGFVSEAEEIVWSNWTDWSACKGLPNGKTVQVRNRSCILQSGLILSRPDPCFLLDNTTNLETIQCDERNRIDFSNLQENDLVVSDYNVRNHNKSNGTGSLRDIFKNVFQDYYITQGKKELTSGKNVLTDEKRLCGLCIEGEVCVALKNEQVPYCLPIIDQQDPTGCGGHCKIDTEICQRLQKNIYRCVEDSHCLEDEWQCSNRMCIPHSKRCDGYFNCYDNTDELNCECNLKTHFYCGNRLLCLPKKKYCDGIVDCWDASDELKCTKVCANKDQFTCNNSQCIPSNKFCDGFSDCLDSSDEPQGCTGDCKKHEWKCRNNRCINKNRVCNGIDDCGDNHDEEFCKVYSKNWQ